MQSKVTKKQRRVYTKILQRSLLKLEWDYNEYSMNLYSYKSSWPIHEFKVRLPRSGFGLRALCQPLEDCLVQCAGHLTGTWLQFVNFYAGAIQKF